VSQLKTSREGKHVFFDIEIFNSIWKINYKRQSDHLPPFSWKIEFDELLRGCLLNISAFDSPRQQKKLATCVLQLSPKIWATYMSVNIFPCSDVSDFK
jgi:hypothetical protein